MNQILITKKLYITPELKRKKKIYKINFILSIFIIIGLMSCYIYANYDRAKVEETSQIMLEDFNNRLEKQEDTTVAKGDLLVVVLEEDETEYTPRDSEETKAMVENKEDKSTNNEKYTTKDGYKYEKIASIKIPKINIEYAILEGETKSIPETDSLLKISPTKFWGANPNEVGNFCIVGHNYRNNRFFSKVPNLKNGDIIEITDTEKRTLRYSVYNNYQVNPNDKSCTSQLTNGQKEITLITCTNDSKNRIIVKARAI